MPAVPQLGLWLQSVIAAADVLDGVAIWRSAARYPGHRIWSDLARVATNLPPVLAPVTLLAQG